MARQQGKGFKRRLTSTERDRKTQALAEARARRARKEAKA